MATYYINQESNRLPCSVGAGVIKVHKGFYEGAKVHADTIVQVVRQQDARVGQPLPVWVTGHSLGGAYANALILHLLERRQTAQLFAAGEYAPKNLQQHC